MGTGILLGAITGLVLGLTGAGGSVFAVPLLMIGLGWSLPQAAPVALLAVCAAATFGTIVAWDVTYIRYRAAALMAAVGLLSAPLGLLAARSLPAAQLSLLFAAVLVIVAIRMLVQATRRPQETRVARATVSGDGGDGGGPVCTLNARGRLVWTQRCVALISAIGAATGFLAGLLGVGGGFVIVPALRAATPLSIHSAVATSLMAIALTSAGTVLVSFATGFAPPWAIALPFVAGALAGMFAGRRIAPRIVGPRLQRGFAATMLAVAALMAARASA